MTPRSPAERELQLAEHCGVVRLPPRDAEREEVAEILEGITAVYNKGGGLF